MMRSKALGSTSIIVVAVAIVACSSDDTGASSSSSSSGSSSGSSSSGDLPTQQTMQGVADAVCDKFAQCASELLVKSIWGSTTNCKARQFAQIKLNIGSPGYTVTDSAAQGCKTALAARSCKDALAGVQPKECDFRGTLADGTACANDQQCVSGSCFVSSTATCGTCGPKVAEGADCTNARCSDGLACGSSKKCVKLGEENATCTTSDDCSALLACAKDKCVTPLAKDATCTVGDGEVPCDGLKATFCIPKAATDTTGTCVEVSFAATGGDCGISQDPIKLTVCENGECNDTSKKCEAHLADGASCSATSGPTCQNPAECRAGKCALRDPSICK